MLKDIKTVTKAIGKVASAVMKGKKILVTKEIIAERQSICDACEFYNIEKKRCSKCGCSTEYKLKLATEECPEGKWKATEKKKPSFMSVNLKDD